MMMFVPCERHSEREINIFQVQSGACLLCLVERVEEQEARLKWHPFPRESPPKPGVYLVKRVIDDDIQEVVRAFYSIGIWAVVENPEYYGDEMTGVIEWTHIPV